MPDALTAEQAETAAKVLNGARVGIKNDTTTRISKLGSGKKIHGKARNM
jgi:hypothetical protein